MRLHILQKPFQSSQGQADSCRGGPSSVPVTVPQPGATLPPPVNDIDITAKAQKNQRDKELRELSQNFGNIPNVPMFTVWNKRLDCSDAAVHRSAVAGICGNPNVGTFSIVLSSLYKDDEDRGDVIIYTGTGGREQWSNAFPPKRLRFGPHTQDQSWDHPSNKALMVSSDTGNSVRVIRSWKCPSQYAPAKGYRYDGLYKVTSCWSARGFNGKKICRCRLERLPDQPPIPERPPTLSTSRRRHRERLVSPDIPGGTSSRPNPQQQDLMPDVDSNKVELGIKEESQQFPTWIGVTSNPGVLPLYRWDSRNNQLIRVPNPEVGGGDEEGCRGEDDAVTLVPSEGDHSDVVVERAATEYFSDCANSPRFETPDEPGSSGSRSQADPGN